MNLYWKCPTCSEENKKRTFYHTRTDVAMREGEIQDLKCTACNKTNPIPVDDFVAKKSNLALIVAGSIGFFGSIAVFWVFFYLVEGFSTRTSLYFVGGYMLVPVVVYQMILKQDQDRVNSFNRHKFK